MILHCQVVAVESASKFTDCVERIVVRVDEADSIHRHFTIRNTEKLSLDTEFIMDLNPTNEERFFLTSEAAAGR